MDLSGTKYTKSAGRLLPLVAAFALACTLSLSSLPALAQSDAYATGAPTLSAYSSPSAATAEDDPQGSLLTIRKRVDEVNVLFIATDKHGKFVRDLNQTDFAILDDHKPPQSILNFRRETCLLYTSRCV